VFESVKSICFIFGVHYNPLFICSSSIRRFRSISQSIRVTFLQVSFCGAICISDNRSFNVTTIGEWRDGSGRGFTNYHREISLDGILTYLLTPCCRVLLEKLTGLQLFKKFPAFHGTRRFVWKQINTAENILRNNVLRSHNHCYNGKATIRSPYIVGLYVTLNSTK